MDKEFSAYDMAVKSLRSYGTLNETRLEIAKMATELVTAALYGHEAFNAEELFNELFDAIEAKVLGANK